MTEEQMQKELWFVRYIVKPVVILLALFCFGYCCAATQLPPSKETHCRSYTESNP